MKRTAGEILQAEDDHKASLGRGVELHAKDLKTSDAGQQGKVDDRASTELCVKDGAKYVFVSKGKV